MVTHIKISDETALDFKPVLTAKALLTDEQTMAIGALAVESASLERTIEILIWVVADINDIGQAFTDRLKLDARIDLLRSVTNQKFADDAPRLEKFKLVFERIKIAIPRRNMAIHGMWGNEHMAPFPFPDSTYAKLPTRSISVNANEVLNLAWQFRHLQDDIMECFQDLLTRPLSDKSE